jgi:hypothetical protein
MKATEKRQISVMAVSPNQVENLAQSESPNDT